MLLNNYCQFFEPLTKKVTVNSKIVDLLSHSLFHLLRVKITATYQGLIQIITNDVNNKLGKNHQGNFKPNHCHNKSYFKII